MITFVFGLVSGCYDTSKDPMSKAKQDYVCKDKGGVYSYQSWLHLRCKNGEVERSWRNAILSPEYYPK